MFLAHLVARHLLPPLQFIHWAYLTSLVTFFFSFSLMGSEQLVIRTTQASGAYLQLPKRVLFVIAGSGAIFLAVYMAALDGLMFKFRIGIVSVPILVSIGAMQLAYQLRRAQRALSASQLIFNSWKLAILPLVIVSAWAFADRQALIAVVAALAFGALLSGRSLLKARTGIIITPGSRSVWKLVFPFAFALGVMSLLGVSDRIIVEKIASPRAFADYVYTLTIIVMPFGMISSYFGFREAVRYRDSFSAKTVRTDSIRTLSLATVMTGVWLVLVYLVRGLINLPFSPLIWLGLAGVAILRCGYSMLSAGMGIGGSHRSILYANVWTLGAILAYALLAIYLQLTLELVVLGYTLLWLVRFAAYYWLIGSGGPVDVTMSRGKPVGEGGIQ